MNTDFSQENRAQKYLQFCLSDEGIKQQAMIFENIEPLLPADRSLKVLDAGCGTGWLAHKLLMQFEYVTGFDSSQVLVDYAAKNYQAKFVVADLEKSLPFADN